MENEKQCTKCKKTRPLDAFHKTSRKYKNKEGEVFIYTYRHAKCNICRRDDKKAWYREQMDSLNDISKNNKKKGKA